MTTDPAVTAAAEAINGPNSLYLIERGFINYDDLWQIVTAARPIIEAERDEHWRNDETIRELLAIHEAVARERIAAEIEARLTRERERHARLHQLIPRWTPHSRPHRQGADVKQIVGTTAWLVGEVWFGLVAALDRTLAYFPRRWGG